MNADTRFDDCLARLREELKTPGAWDRFEAAGLHVTPVHFYQPLPDLRALPAEIFQRRSTLSGIDMRAGEQRERFERLAGRWLGEFAAFPELRPDGNRPSYHTNNGYFNFMDGFLLYALLRERKPRRVVEVGSGYSTLLMAAALERNRQEGHDCRFESFDPYPRDGLGLAQLDRVSFTPLLAQQIPAEIFTTLEAGDFLFIDSSHVVKIGSDVHYLALEIYPRLAVGVWLHVHDIFLPFDYSENWVRQQRRFWNEQYLLQAFLQCNSAFAVRWAARYMHEREPAMLAERVAGYGQGFKGPGGSFWLERVA